MKSFIFFVFFAFLIASINAALKPRIAGGADADITLHPYQASIRARNQHFCGATIISEKHILTAAHCFTDNPSRFVAPPYRDVSVHTGINYLTEIGRPHRIARVTVHPKSKTKVSVSTNDIAVITLESPIVFDANQRKAELPIEDVVSNTVGNLTGWGRLSVERNAPHATRLQKLTVTLLTAEDCQQHIPLEIQPKEICAIHSPGHGSCRGDSGGPLVSSNYIVGILSWVHDSHCLNGLPEVYTNVYAYKDFIASTMRKYP